MITASLDVELPPMPDRLRVKTFRVANRTLSDAYLSKGVEIDVVDLDDAAVDQVTQLWAQQFRTHVIERRKLVSEQRVREDALRPLQHVQD